MSQLTHHWTYHDVVAAEYGKAGLLSLKIAIIINNAGSMVRWLTLLHPPVVASDVPVVCQWWPVATRNNSSGCTAHLAEGCSWVSRCLFLCDFNLVLAESKHGLACQLLLLNLPEPGADCLPDNHRGRAGGRAARLQWTHHKPGWRARPQR